MSRVALEPNTTLFPVPIVLVTCGTVQPNVFTANRISSCNAEPPMLALSVRPSRYSHQFIVEYGEFVVNIPGNNMAMLSDYVGVTTGHSENKWQAYGLTPTPAQVVAPPLIAECPVNLECRVIETLKLPSHTLFIGQVVAMHAMEAVLDQRGEVNFQHFAGLRYDMSVVRERPVKNVNVQDLRASIVKKR
jgi:flavin reductase (DIM6/NTAB) family NADH-FMN oxidoreductase RutF